MNADRPELRALTSVRGLAAWMVVLYHIRLSIPGLPQGALDVLARGYLAVDFFFLLSGFVIWLTYGERLRAGGFAAVSDFLKRRVARIWPLHLVVLGFGVALAILLAASGRHEPLEFPFAELPLHVLLLQNWGFTDDLTWNDPAWSISAELGAYLLFPLLVLAIDWRRISTPALAAAVCALLVTLHLLLAANGETTLNGRVAQFGLLRCLFEFIAGTALCALWLRWRDRPALPAALAIGLTMLLGLGFALGLAETFAAPLALAALLLALALSSGTAGHPLEGRLVHWLGEISYATYLSHFLLWKAFKLAFVDDTANVAPALIALYLALVLLASAGLYHWVERPAQRRINRLRLGAPRGYAAASDTAS